MLNTEKKSNNLIIRYSKVLPVILLSGGLVATSYGWYESNNEVKSLEGELKVQVEGYKNISAQLTEANEDNTLLMEQNKVLSGSYASLTKQNEKLMLDNANLAGKLAEKYSTAVSSISQAKKKIEEAEALRKAAMETQTSYTNQSNQSVSSAGTFRVTAYGADCNGCTGITASGKRPIQGVTVAADPSVLPLGTVVYIEFPNAPKYNGTYTVQDTGGAIKGNRLDLFLGTEANSQSFGVQTAKVTILGKK